MKLNDLDNELWKKNLSKEYTNYVVQVPKSEKIITTKSLKLLLNKGRFSSTKSYSRKQFFLWWAEVSGRSKC